MGMRLGVSVVLAALMLGAVSTAQATESYVHTPKSHIKVVKHFKPTPHPSVSYAPKIMDIEQKIWGGPSIKGRAWCESGYRWYTGNGTYNGILAIGGPAWNILWPGTPRTVRIVKKHKRWARINRVTIWDSGRKTKKHIGSIHQRVKVVKKGTLPRNPSVYHAWAVIRAVQRYVAGYNNRGTVTWSCGL